MTEKRKATKKRTYIVEYRESAIITETVQATSQTQAIQLVKAGEGQRMGFEIDETRFPTSFEATTEI